MAWAAGDITEAIAGQEAIVERYPTDLLAVQQAQYHYFYQGKCEKLLHVTEKAFAANTDNHYLHGMLAFGHEQCQNYQAAEQFGRQAIALNRNDVWAQHAVAHVLDSQSRLAEGIAWMESHVDTWQDCNSMLYTHNWWHVALYYLKLKQFDKVLQLYDQEIWGQAHKESPKDQVGAISLLGRLELAGMTVGEQRWAELAPYAALRVHEHTLLFQDLHYLYALSRAHQTHHVQTLLESLTHHIQGLPPSQWVWRKVGLPLAKGIVVYQQHHWQTAVAYFEPVLGRLRSIGGSRTQRELFEAIYYDAFKRSLSSHSRSWRMAS
jgi:tetratricopeptide (TPR) repeat protein